MHRDIKVYLEDILLQHLPKLKEKVEDILEI